MIYDGGQGFATGTYVIQDTTCDLLYVENKLVDLIDCKAMRD